MYEALHAAYVRVHAPRVGVQTSEARLRSARKACIH
jgi:hypothetical protein